MVLQSAEDHRHTGAATDAHNAWSALAHAVFIDAVDQALRVGRKHVGQRPVESDDAEHAQRAAEQQADRCAHQQWQELQRGDAHPVWNAGSAVHLGQREGNTQANHDHAQQQHQEPALDV